MSRWRSPTYNLQSTGIASYNFDLDKQSFLHEVSVFPTLSSARLSAEEKMFLVSFYAAMYRPDTGAAHDN